MRLFPVSQRRIPIKIINHMDNVIEMGRNDYKLEFMMRVLKLGKTCYQKAMLT